MADLSIAQQALLSLRNDYIDALPERCEMIENLILNLGTSTLNLENYQSLYRDIHSIKGSAGTHGFESISTICHQFEDWLAYIEKNQSSLTKRMIDGCLKYNDIIREAIILEGESKADLSPIYTSLDVLHETYFGEKYQCMIVDPSRSRLGLYKSALSQLPLDISIMHNGYYALEPLLRTKCDILITSLEVPLLNGIALIQAVKASDSINRDMHTVLLSSFNSGVGSKAKDRVANKTADDVIRKDTELLENLVANVEAYIRLREVIDRAAE